MMLLPPTLWVLLVTAPCNDGTDLCTDAPSVWLSLEDCLIAAEAYPTAEIVACDAASTETDP